MVKIKRYLLFFDKKYHAVVMMENNSYICMMHIMPFKPKS